MSQKFTKEEAQRVFSLAAERQQANEKEDANQLSIDDLEEAGIAAGIDPAFIRAAASDLLRPNRITHQRTFFGFPVEFRESHILPLAFNEANWKKSVDIFSYVYGKPGRTREVGTTKHWSSEQNDNQIPAQIIAEKEEDGTRFTIERKTWPMTLGLGIGAATILATGLIFFGLALYVEPDLSIPASIMMGVGLLFSLFGTMGLKIFSRQELKRFENVFTYLEEMVPDNMPQSDVKAAEHTDANRTATNKKNHVSLDDIPEKEITSDQSIKSRERT